MKDEREYSLLGHNTFGIDAKCSRYVEFATEEEAARFFASNSVRDYMLLGSGSNLLLTGDYRGTVFSPRQRFEVEAEDGDADGVSLRCWAGTVFDDVVEYGVREGFHGLENLSIIPGEVGASAVQNIGAYGAEIKDVIERVEAIELSTGRKIAFAPDDCAYSYRQSKFKSEWRDRFFITYVTYRLSKHFTPLMDYGNIRAALASKGITEPTARELRATVIEIRNAKLPDPKVEGNAGSFFMNPVVGERQFRDLQAQYADMPYYEVTSKDGQRGTERRAFKIPAGWMIDRCGWKGKSLGPAGVHDKQALVLVNRGGASGQDILRLCRTIQKDVRERFGIELKAEVNIR